MIAQLDGDRRARSLNLETDRTMIDRLWNCFVAAWFEGKDDPKLVLLRLDAERDDVGTDRI